MPALLGRAGGPREAAGKSRASRTAGSGEPGPEHSLLPPCHFRPEMQELGSNPQCPGLASEKPEDVEEEEEEELEEEDEDSLAGKSQEDTVSPPPEPQGAYEDEEDEEPPASLAVGFDHTRRWGRLGAGGSQGGAGHLRAAILFRPPRRHLQPGLLPAQQAWLLQAPWEGQGSGAS